MNFLLGLCFLKVFKMQEVTEEEVGVARRSCVLRSYCTVVLLVYNQCAYNYFGWGSVQRA